MLHIGFYIWCPYVGLLFCVLLLNTMVSAYKLYIRTQSDRLDVIVHEKAWHVDIAGLAFDCMCAYAVCTGIIMY